MIAAMLASSPRIERPSGWSGKAAIQRSSKMMSDGVSRASPSSWSTTSFSRAEIAGVEMRPQDHVGEQLDAERQMLGEQARR